MLNEQRISIKFRHVSQSSLKNTPFTNTLTPYQWMVTHTLINALKPSIVIYIVRRLVLPPNYTKLFVLPLQEYPLQFVKREQHQISGGSQY